MELRIGMQHSPRELSFETNASAAEIEQIVSSGDAFYRFQDEKGKVYLVKAEQLAYLELGEENQRRVGFVA